MPPTPPPPAPPAPPAPPRHKSVTFCTRCSDTERDRYHSDPGLKTAGRRPPSADGQRRSDSTDSGTSKKYQGYYSEPDAKYFEIDYEFLKQLRRIAKINCPKCERRSSGKRLEESARGSEAPKSAKKETYILCKGRYHLDREHCQVCCKVCSRSTDTLDSLDEERYSPVCRSSSLPAGKVVTSRAKSSARPPSTASERKASIQSTKSVSFLESEKEKDKGQTNYTAKSFTNDLKQFLLRPAAPRLSLRDKLIVSLKQEFEAKKTSPKLRAIKGLWKSF